MDLTPKQQTSEAIRQAETILITTGSRPNVDQAAAVLALSAILRKFGKKVSAVVSDPMPQSASFLDTSSIEKSLSGLRDFVLKIDVTKTEVDKLRYEVQDAKLKVFLTPFKGGFAPSDVSFEYGDYHYDLVIVLGVPSRSRMDRIHEEHQPVFQAVPLVNIDFHRINENYGAINLIEPTASSLCEMLVALSESLQSGMIDEEIATVMLTGLMASTDRFTAAHTTSKSLTVAAQMMAAGARQQAVVRGLFRSCERPEPSRNDRLRDETAKPFVNKPFVPAPKPVVAPISAPANPPQPVIEPDHIELSQPNVDTVEAYTQEPQHPAEPMADFEAAASILRQRQDELTIHPHHDRTGDGL